ncbi:MAG: sigma-54-dependent Fis family transcriptional regulator [Magnetococcales bacterium]|nr:sigma-54-dependent Fis family transcriptional regulator [Magnetococcales bacterium]
MARILLCDDEKNLRDLLSLALEESGHQTQEAANGSEALKLLEEDSWDLFITDLKLPDISGLELLRRAKQLANTRPVILITAHASAATAVTAMKEGAFDYLEKPFSIEDLNLIVTRSLEQGALVKENVELKKELKAKHEHRDIIANSAAMRQVLELANRVARTDASVLVTGESGTGKELIARFIHNSSKRSNGPFIAINCAAIPENLIESELFGHAKGAFSGAVNSRKGVFIEAQGGTLLLDEIGEMPMNIQATLLRVLQERVIRPVGGTGDTPVDVRVITTTNRDLTVEVAEKHFREDLYYRINVVNFKLPSLRNRREDIPLLVARFVETFAKRYDLPIKGVSPEVMDCLAKNPLSGNIRELQNIIEGAVSLTPGNIVEITALPEHIRNAKTLTQNSSQAQFQLPDEGMNLEKYLLDIELKAINQALEQTKGNKTKAAEILGMSFRSFRYRLKKLNMEDEEG